MEELPRFGYVAMHPLRLEGTKCMVFTAGRTHAELNVIPLTHRPVKAVPFH